ncbi:MAG: DUF4314 domain-containing protein [Saccharofermentanales bacterium]
MNRITPEYLGVLRKRYPSGTRVELVHMDDPYTKLKPGDQGNVLFVDDCGTIHVSWSCGSTLGIVNGVDSCRIIKE